VLERVTVCNRRPERIARVARTGARAAAGKRGYRAGTAGRARVASAGREVAGLRGRWSPREVYGRQSRVQFIQPLCAKEQGSDGDLGSA